MNQFQPINCIRIELGAYPTQVHQLHMSKNSFNKLHNDKLDFDCSFICWFIANILNEVNLEFFNIT